MDTAIFHADGCATFEFAPVTGTVLLTNTGKVLNASSFGNDLNICNLTDDFEVHAGLYYQRLAYETSQPKVEFGGDRVPMAGGEAEGEIMAYISQYLEC